VRAFLLPHIAHLQKKGIIIEIATCLDDNSTLREDLKGVNIHHIPFSRNIFSLKNIVASFKLYKFLKRTNFHLIHVHTPIASFITRLVNLQKKVPLVYTAHGFHFHEQGSKLTNAIFKFFEKAAGNWLDKLIVINEEDYNQAISFLDSTKVRLIHGIGIDINRFLSKNMSLKEADLKLQLKIPPEQKVLIHLAEFNKNKRQIDLVEAAKILKERRDDFLFLLVGEGPLREKIERIIAEENLSNYVKTLGFRTDIVELLSMSDIGLNVSLREGLPRSIMEMMLLQLPVVATNIRGNRDLVQHNESGFLVPVQSPKEIAKHCGILLDDSEKWKTYGRKGKEIIESNYDLPKVLKAIDEVYEEVGL
jgi:glycosyltransferase involved in cell wall biosynthesis